ncbi:MAG TPA: serpin family protein, partial [Jatrophihabitantaceae bacterium]|nr:serpin family protein [Jatrophihabitantaceae bacterium]
LGAFVVLVALAGCASARESPPAQPPSTYAPIAQLTRAVALDADGRFGADLLSKLGGSSGNAVLSPYSIAVALQMALEGARGQTAAQMAKTLHVPGVTAAQLTATAAALRHDLAALDDPQRKVTLRIANGMWPQAGYPIKAPFTTSLRDGFGVAVRQLDFGRDPQGARRTINEAVSEQTNGKIAELLKQDLDPMTRLVLTNAVYLKAAWTVPFQSDQTRPDAFHKADGSVVPAPFMHQVGELGYAKHDGYQLVRLPYGAGDLAMTLIVPDGGLAPLENALGERGLAAVLGGPLASAQVTLALPKFKVRTHAELVDTLKQLGMTDAFDEIRADFGGIADEQLVISQVAHEAYISVDEGGTEATAATGVVMVPASGSVDPPTVTVDHPFLFAITDTKTGTPLFLGRVTDPTAG